MGFGFQYAQNFYGRKIDQYVSDWLYGDYDKQKLDRFTALYSIPGVHEYFDYLLDKRADQEYLNRYQMTYSDIHDPRKLRQVSSGARMIGSTYNFVSSNVSDLYEDFNSKHKKKK